MRPAEVLDQQMALYDHLASPSYVGYMQNFMDDVHRKKNGAVVTDEKGKPSGWYWTRREQAGLKMANAYFISADMLALARHASLGLDEYDRFERDLWPSDFGFMWLDGGLVTKEAWGKTITVQAIAWKRLPGGPVRDVDGGHALVYNGYELTFYTDLEDDRDEMNQLIKRDYIAVDKVQAENYAKMGRLQVNHFITMHDGERVGPPTHVPPQQLAAFAAGDLDLTSEVPNDHRVILAILLLLNQTVASVKEHEVERTVAKRARRMKFPARVTVVTLRRSEDNNRYAGESMVEWAHRWIVGHFWRWQPRGPRNGPGVAEHNHVTPNRADTTYTVELSERGSPRILGCNVEGCEGISVRIFINDFFKGPEDKPLKQSDKVYALLR